MINLEKLFEDNFQPVLPVDTVIVEVNIEVSDLMYDAAETYSMEADRVMRFTTNENYQISRDEFVSYFKTLLFLRVARVNGLTNKVTALYRNDMRNYCIPAFMSTLINSIGKATDNDFGFTFVPRMDIAAEDLLSDSEMRSISKRLSVLNMQGLTCVETGISMSPLGDLNAMAVFSVQHDVRSYRKNHPIFGFYAAFFNHTLVTEVMDPSSLRIRYGAQSDYRMYVNQIVSGEKK